MSESSSGGILKGLVGCGCVLVIIALVVGGVFVWGTIEAFHKIQEIASTVSVDDVDTEVSEIAKRILPDGHGEFLDNVVDAIARPLSKDDVERFVDANDWFFAQPEHEKALAAHKAISVDGASPMEFFEKQRDLVASHDELLDLMKRFNNYVGFNGGYLKQADSALRTVAVAAAADLVGRATGKDPWEESVAEEMYEYAGKARNAAEGASDEDLMKLAAEFGAGDVDIKWVKPGIIGLSRLPDQSFETWQKVGRPQRKKAVEAYRRQASTVLAAQLNPILRTAPILESLPVP